MISRTIDSRYLLCLIYICGLAGLVSAGEAEDYRFSPQQVLRFAEYLYNEGEYLRAAGEMQRYLFLAPEAADADSVYYLMAKAALRGGDYARAQSIVEFFLGKYRDSIFAARLGIYKSIIEYYQGNFHESIKLALGESGACRSLKRLVIALNYVNLGLYDSARIWADVSADTGRISMNPSYPCEPYEKLSAELYGKIPLADTVPFKNPIMAGVFSAVLPGAGKVYCGRTMDGVYSLLLIGLAGWQAYDGFHDDGWRSTRGIFFGAMAGTFYAADIYGSNLAARLHNRLVNQKIRQGIRIEIDLP